MKFLRGLLCLIFVDLALNPLKKRIEEIADRLAGIFVAPRSVHKGLPSVKDMYLHERDNCTAFRWDASALTATYERGSRKQGLPQGRVASLGFY